MRTGIPLADPASVSPDRRRDEAEALTNDVVAGVERTVRVWNKAHEPAKAALSAGEHTIAVLQGMAIATAQQAAALTIANPGSNSDWLRTMLIEQFGEAFDAVRAGAVTLPASPREQ